MNPITITLDGEGISYTAKIGPLGNVHITGVVQAVAPVPTSSPAAASTPAPIQVNNVGGIGGVGNLRIIDGGSLDVSGSTSTKYSGPMNTGDAYVYEMITGDASQTVCNVSVAEYSGADPVRTISISEKLMDFSGSISVGKQASIYFTVGIFVDGTYTFKPNTRYYVNIKNCNQFADPTGDTCLPGKACPFILNLRH